jgi:hypothetical protein
VSFVLISPGMLILFALWLGSSRAPQPLNACEVLSKRDVAAVQGTRFRSATLSTQATRDVQISHCLYRLPQFSDSVSVDVIRGKTHEFWKRHFANVRDEGETHHASTNERTSRAMRVSGVGDSAVWSGTKIAGALYVMQGDTVLRVSVGGSATQEEKIEKSKKLATRALPRL